MNKISLFILMNTAAFAVHAAPVLPVPYVVAPVAPAVLHPIQPSAVRIEGWLGARIDANERHRLLVVDTEP